MKGRGGWISYTMLQRLVKAVPRHRQFAMDAVSYSSPGFFRFSGRTDQFDELVLCLAHVRSQSNSIELARQVLDDAMKSGSEPDLDEKLRLFTEALHFIDLEKLSFVAGDAFHAAAVVRSFHNRIRTILGLQLHRRVCLLSASPDEILGETFDEEDEEDEATDEGDD